MLIEVFFLLWEVLTQYIDRTLARIKTEKTNFEKSKLVFLVKLYYYRLIFLNTSLPEPTTCF